MNPLAIAALTVIVIAVGILNARVARWLFPMAGRSSVTWSHVFVIALSVVVPIVLLVMAAEFPQSWLGRSILSHGPEALVLVAVAVALSAYAALKVGALVNRRRAARSGGVG